MSTRPFLCPSCQLLLGTVTRWCFRGNVHARLRTSGRSILVEKTWRGTFLHCPCGKRLRLSEDIEVMVR